MLTGFPWNVLGYALTYPLVLMQSAGALGIYALTLWCVVIFAAPLTVAADAQAARFRAAALKGAVDRRRSAGGALGVWRSATFGGAGTDG